jgi:hypothetical protein
MGSRNLLDVIAKESKYTFKKALSERKICEIVDSAIHSEGYEFSGRYQGVTVSSYDDFNMLGSHVLAQVLEGLAASSETQIKQNKKKFWQKVAAPDLIVGDYDATSTFLYDGFAGLNREDLDLMATIGHAVNAHGAFRDHGKFPNTNFDDVMNALRGASKKISNPEIYGFPVRCQQDIDDYAETMLFRFFDDKKKKRKLVNASGEFLGRLQFLDGFQAHSLGLLAGWMFTSMMDSEDVRDDVESLYGHRMGRGETFAVDRERLAYLGINLDELAKRNYDYEFINHLDQKQLIKMFRKAGVIVSTPVDPKDIDHRMSWSEAKEQFGMNTALMGGDIIQAYIRAVRGLGVMDDVAIFLSGYLLPSFKNVYEIVNGVVMPYHDNDPSELMSQLLGGAGADRVDTKEKYSYWVVEGGQDHLSGLLAAAKYAFSCQDKGFRDSFGIPHRSDGVYELLDRGTIVDFTLASAKLKYDIHSSARYFLMGKDVAGFEEQVKNGELTCTTNEIFRLAAEIAQHIHIPCESLYKGSGYPPCDLTVGFHAVPWETVMEEMKDRLGIVVDPVHRKRRLGKMVEEYRAGMRGERN